MLLGHQLEAPGTKRNALESAYNPMSSEDMDTSLAHGVPPAGTVCREHNRTPVRNSSNTTSIFTAGGGLSSEINRLKALVAKLQRMQFGKSSEKVRAKTERQIQEAQERISALQEEMAETLGEQYDPALPSPCASLLPVNRYRPHFPVKPGLCGRKRNAVLPVVVNSVLWDVMCQSNWSLSSSAFKVIETQRPKLACSGATHIGQAPVPSKPIAQIMPERGFWPML